MFVQVLTFTYFTVTGKIVPVSGAAHWRTEQFATLHLLCAGGFLPAACGLMMREYALIVQNTRLVGPAMEMAAYERWQRDKQAAKRT